MNEHERKSVYEDRYLAFIDILGFANLVRLSTQDESVAERLLRLFGHVDSWFEKQGRGGFCATYFSDTICLSVPKSHNPAAFCLGLSSIVTGMLGMGYAVRGAITAGPLYHRHPTIFGPCMVRAYELERKLAIYPRIIIDPLITIPIGEEEREFDVLMHDVDGLDYVNTLSPLLYAVMLKFMKLPLPDMQDAILASITRLLAYAPDDASREKLQWLHSYAGRVIDAPQPESEKVDRFYRSALAALDRASKTSN